ncbi:MAG: hypothetical protein M3440_15145 [Chloroflexota bacterium]|nr:hypothetical protein [Chloroflexota bacterium]
MIGSRLGAPTAMRRLVARATASTLAAFVVPDARTARAMGLDLPAAGLEIVANPRHASVLVVIGHLPHGLAEAAAVAYAQMPRPRAVLALGANSAAPLPDADITAESSQTDLIDGVARIRDQIAHHSWSSTPDPFTAAVLEQAADGADDGMDHGMMDHGGHDMESPDPHSGHQMPPWTDQHAAQGNHAAGVPDDHQAHMHGEPVSAADDHATTGQTAHATPGHDAMDHTGHEATDYDPAPPADAHAGMRHGNHAGIDHGDHASMDHSGMDHGMMGHDHHMMDGGFMSMIAMTRDLPRSRDGLPMEWVEAPFGPLFPGLPGGLAPILTLDGDTVVTATLTTGVMHRDVATSLPGPVSTFPDRLAALDPWAPVAYRLLAGRALEAIDGSTIHDAVDHPWIGALERERAINHLGWLATFGEVFGIGRTAQRAAELQLALVRSSNVAGVMQLRSGIDRFLRDAGRIPLLGRRLAGIAVIDPPTAASAHGPVARGSGVTDDARAEDPAYRALGFAPILREDGDALARFQVRLADISQSLDLVAAANSLTIAPANVSPDLSGTGMATIETPRGTAGLHIEVDQGHVHMAHVQTPSATHVALLPRVTEGAELADALVGIASLDLSPWEIDQ